MMISVFNDTVHRGRLNFDDFDFDSALGSVSSLLSLLPDDAVHTLWMTYPTYQIMALKIAWLGEWPLRGMAL
jgi:hypothetical protein